MNVEVVIQGLENNPQCFHGPSLLFRQKGERLKEYYACSACRDRKECPFYMDVLDSKKNNFSKWINIRAETVRNILAKNPYQTYLKILRKSFDEGNKLLSVTSQNGKRKTKGKTTDFEEQLKISKSSSGYCYTCEELFEECKNHENDSCKIVKNLTTYQLKHPTEILIPKENNKTHAQYFFSEETVKNIVLLLSSLQSKRILCIGAPRVHEYLINENSEHIRSLLLDIDLKYYNFYSEKQFIWYNMFNNYILKEDCLTTLEEFLQCDKVTVLMDPPFGGRVEPLAYTLQGLNKLYQRVNGTEGKVSDGNLSVMWIFPYFMERQIKSSLPNFKMFDLKINYDNHSSFTNIGSRKRKFGSPIRIFTNIPLSKFNLEGVDGYKFCKNCDHWVSEENRHCDECNSCSSKNGRTYTHCWICSRCVKPSYQHCDICGKCALPDHPCVKSSNESNSQCYHCKKPGHKKRNCPEAEGRKRKKRKLDKGRNGNFRSPKFDDSAF